MYHNKWVRFSFWAVLYVLWVIWIKNFWWLLGLIVVFDLYVTKKVKWAFWKKTYKEGEKHNVLLDWLDAIIYAVIVVTFINIFFFQAFKIPSSSMESSLMTGDYLFVDKLCYGPRLPQTPLSIPFMHNTLPGGKKESYSTALQFDYKRIAGFGKVERDDYVVFNFPHGDTILRRVPADDYYTHVRLNGREYTQRQFGPVVARPYDKADHYVKRCVAVAGDTLSVVDGFVYVNGKKQKAYDGIQLTYKIETDGTAINSKILSNAGVSTAECWFDQNLPGYPAMPLTDNALSIISKLPNVKSVNANVDTYPADFPDSPQMLFPFVEMKWTRDNYGPIWIPAKGATVDLTLENLPLYSRIISSYEQNSLEVKDGTIYINGEAADSYTFKLDYYFMMGDNRHNSLDSRYWGFVPETHIVGKPAVIWLSTDSSDHFPRNIRWKRLFKFLY
ncbi:MAG: signal peptidase I [Bacteroidales bacterium]|nr:signal peptidase I [Bacteroidales bacterium]